MKITEKIVNIETGDETIIERDETPVETKARFEYESKIAQAKAQAEAKESARQALFAKLGITADEAKLLLS